MVRTSNSHPPKSRRTRILRRAIIAVAGVLTIAGLYWQFALPWASRWGAREVELDSVLPGDHVVRRPKSMSTRAITIHRPPADVYPWLAQMGQARGGFYSYERLENLAGCQIHNAGRIVPEWQNPQVGDPVALHPKLPDAFRIAELRPSRYILLQAGAVGGPATSTWLFYLFDEGSDSTRLVVRSRGTWAATPVNFLIFRVITEPLHFIMERAMLLGIRDRVEKRRTFKESS